MKRRDSLAPRMTHKCAEMPEEFPSNERGLDDENGTPEELFYPTKPVRIILHSDGVWYLIVQEEFCIPITHCPFCGEDLNSSTEKPPPPPEAVEVGALDDGFQDEDDEETVIEIEAE